MFQIIKKKKSLLNLKDINSQSWWESLQIYNSLVET